MGLVVGVAETATPVPSGLVILVAQHQLLGRPPMIWRSVCGRADLQQVNAQVQGIFLNLTARNVAPLATKKLIAATTAV